MNILIVVGIILSWIIVFAIGVAVADNNKGLADKAISTSRPWYKKLINKDD